MAEDPTSGPDQDDADPGPAERESVSDSEPESESEPEPEQGPETSTEPEQGPETSTEPGMETEAEPEPDAEPRMDPGSGMDSESEPGMDTEPAAESTDVGETETEDDVDEDGVGGDDVDEDGVGEDGVGEDGVDASGAEGQDADEDTVAGAGDGGNASIPADVRRYERFKKMDGAQYERVNEFLRDRTYITAREWAIARLCADFRTETGVEMTKIGENLPELVPFMTDTYTPQAVNQARSSFEDKVTKAGATFLYGAMSGFFTA